MAVPPPAASDVGAKDPAAATADAERLERLFADVLREQEGPALADEVQSLYDAAAAVAGTSRRRGRARVDRGRRPLAPAADPCVHGPARAGEHRGRAAAGARAPRRRHRRRPAAGVAPEAASASSATRRPRTRSTSPRPHRASHRHGPAPVLGNQRWPRRPWSSGRPRLARHRARRARGRDPRGARGVVGHRRAAGDAPARDRRGAPQAVLLRQGLFDAAGELAFQYARVVGEEVRSRRRRCASAAGPGPTWTATPT